MELLPHQLKAVKETPNKHGLFFMCRVGKTPTSIRLACSRTKKALVICPKSLVSNWEIEIARWNNTDCNFIIITKEQIIKKWDTLQKCEAIIIDECHMAFANYKNKIYKALECYLKKYNPSCVWILTGTPFTSSSWSVYSYGKLLGKDWDWYKWSNHFFYKVKMGHKMIPMPKPNMSTELQQIIHRIGTTIDIKDVMEVPEDEDIIETFSLNSEQKKLIKDSFDPLPIVRFTRQHQIESGVLKGDGYTETKQIECEKDKRLIEIAEENDKLIIVCRYLAQMDKYEKIFNKRRTYRISGQEKRTAADVAQRAEQDDNCIILVQGDTVAGYNLQSFSMVVFASMSYSFVNYEQVRYRVKNMQKKTPCTYIHLITEGKSVDKAVYDCVQKKQDFSIELFNNK